VTARLDIELFVAGSAGGSLDATLVYATDLYDRTTMAELAGRFVQLLRDVVADPARPVLEGAPLS
jgi:non-ribosomal peptide synthetase component F